MKDEAYKLLLENRRITGGRQYTVPSPERYPYQWLWDSCFHAIVLSHFEIDAAKEELRSLVYHQFDNGMIPHVIYWEHNGPLRENLQVRIKKGSEEVSTITQPPLAAEAVWRIFEKSGDRNFLREMYPHLCAFYRYLLTERDPRGNNLVSIVNPYESGEDNSPRFDKPLGLEPRQPIDEENYKRRNELIEKSFEEYIRRADVMKEWFWVKDVPFNSYVVKNLGTLSLIAGKLGMGEKSREWAESAKKVGEAMRKRMFENGIFWSTYDEDYKKIYVKTWGIFAPLYANLYTPEEAGEIVKMHLLNREEFRAEYMVPTVSRSEPSYNPSGYWRGPVWIAVNWFIYRGLKNYGFEKEAEMIKESSRKLIEENGFREYFNPETGEGLGAHNFTWGALIVDMV